MSTSWFSLSWQLARTPTISSRRAIVNQVSVPSHFAARGLFFAKKRKTSIPRAFLPASKTSPSWVPLAAEFWIQLPPAY